MNFSFNPDTFSALKSRNFRLFLVGQAISLTGLWMQKLANTWLVYRLTESAFKLGVVELVSQAPIFIVGLLAGAWLDRHDIRLTLIVTQILSMLHAITISILLLLGVIEFWHILILSFYLGIINSIDLPARQSSIMLMVENKRQLKSALSLHSMLFNLSRLVGPSLGGFIIYYTSETTCFIINATTYIPVIGVLLIIKFNERKVIAKKQNALASTIEGLQYLGHSFPLRSIFTFLAIFATFSYSYSVLFPIFAKDILMGDSKLLGFLLGGVGLGAIFGAFSLASIVRLRQLPASTGVASVIYAIALGLFAFSESAPLSILLTIPAGFGLVATFVSINTLVQTVADDDKRGRVVSLYTVLNMGLGPIGAFLAGFMAEFLNARITMLIWALLMLGGSLFLWSRMGRINRELKPCFDEND